MRVFCAVIMLASIAVLPNLHAQPSATPAPIKTSTVLLTSAKGDQQKEIDPIVFKQDLENRKIDAAIIVDSTARRQTITGIGTSFTESSAYVLAHLEPSVRATVMRALFSDRGADFSLTRTMIGSSDFSVHGRYNYAPVVDDSKLSHFSIGEDLKGFDLSAHPRIVDANYDLLPMIQEALAIKQDQRDAELSIIASAWTAPPWMKDIENYYQPGTPETNFEGTGGQLKSGYESLYADYLLRYMDAYAQQGIAIWGITPVNEPEGNSGQWESMHFTPDSQATFITEHLGPKLRQSPHKDTKLLIFDQNRNHLESWTNRILGDATAAQYVYGTAVHWYSSTVNVYGDALERVHAQFPQFDIIHTEGTIDDLGKPAGGGIGDPKGFEETNWFNNDDFWWQKTATDWAYTASWAPNANDHPMYTPVHRYARNIIGSLNHWVSGWIDWNPVLDARGGPNHVGNFCGAPIMIDLDTKQVYYTPIFHILSQFSRTIRPGDTVLTTAVNSSQLPPDALHAVASINADGLISVQILNTGPAPITLGVTLDKHNALITMPANALKTIQFNLAL